MIIDMDRGCTVLIDKPLDWTSFDVVNKIRYTFKHAGRCSKLKIGHAGTLDPKATGLLVVCMGKHTKKIQAFQNFPKRYSGEICLGKTTPSYDSELEPDAFFDIDHIDEAKIEETRLQFIGTIDQVPPAFSAIKIKGRVAYKAARKGKQVDLPTRKIKITDFRIGITDWPVLGFEVSCSKGTYIRSLAHDFGKALDSGAYLASLRRTRIGPFDVRNAWSLQQFLDVIESNSLYTSLPN